MEKRKQHIESIMKNMRVVKQKVIACEVKSGITSAQWSVLTLIMNRGEIGIKGIAEILGITSSATTQLVDELEKKQYIVRESNENDRRAISLKLSDKRKKEMEDMRMKRKEQLMMVFDVLNDEELAQLAQLNKKIVDNFLKNNI